MNGVETKAWARQNIIGLITLPVLGWLSIWAVVTNGNRFTQEEGHELETRVRAVEIVDASRGTPSDPVMEELRRIEAELKEAIADLARRIE